MNKVVFTTEQKFLDKLNTKCSFQNENLGGEKWCEEDIREDHVRDWCYDDGSRRELCYYCKKTLGKLDDWRNKKPIEQKFDDLVTFVNLQANELDRIKRAIRGDGV